ncbi:MAG TPA: CoA pyrophosphatase [Vicinamibacterales bacterium]|nr:CoA pyrophosphatase [Vicinamibacterales bacterium]
MRFTEVIARLEIALLATLPGANAHQWLAPRPRRAWPQDFNPARIRHAAGLLLIFPRADTQVGPYGVSANTQVDSHNVSANTPGGPDGASANAAVGPHRAPANAPANLHDVSADTPARDSDFGSSNASIVLTVRADTVRHGGQVSLPGGVVEPGETYEQAARRETHEEIALPVDAAHVLGALTPIDIPISGFRLHPIVAAVDAPPTLRPSDAEVAQILAVDVDELRDPANFLTHDRVRDGRALAVPGFHVHGYEIWGATAMILAEFLVLLGWTPTDAN